ncbi:MAG: flavodoxin-dependent (E)-4-hydroxy-3-methylbut-2-enyl-diphosphate synthase [Clostridiales bacterium]|nr:flavodoxin-dependent (E)-4-hydroxy-3-methylbut-2-enyl-diphosphate synthase [Clostridiales bacterium]
MAEYTKKIRIGDKYIGGGEPILIQSMCNTDTRNVAATIEQIKRLEEAGCEIIRVAVLDNEAACAIKEIKKQIHIPIVADIHFDYKLAIASIENGADKIRINPGNIGSIDNIKQVVNKAKEYDIPIRVGVNGGSLAKDVLAKYGKVTVEGLVESAYDNVKILEDLDFNNMVVSLKVSNVPMTVEAYNLLAKKCDYPLHIGVTEAGTLMGGTIKNSLGIGVLLSQGIGDTLRVSLTADPVEEVKVGWQILKGMGIRKRGVDFTSCPTCGRTKVNMLPIAEKVERAVENLNMDIKVAVMGCAVNGPGEAQEADFGVACGDNCGLLFKKGEIVKKVAEEDIVEELLELIQNS